MALDFLEDKVDTIRQDLETAAKVDKLDTDFDRALTEVLDNIAALNTMDQCQSLFASDDFEFYWLVDSPDDYCGERTAIEILERHLYDYLYTQGQEIKEEIKERLQAEADEQNEKEEG